MTKRVKPSKRKARKKPREWWALIDPEFDEPYGRIHIASRWKKNCVKWKNSWKNCPDTPNYKLIKVREVRRGNAKKK